MRPSIALSVFFFSMPLLTPSALATPPVFVDPTVSKTKWKPENAVMQIKIGAESFDVEGLVLPDAKSPQDPSRMRVFRRDLKEDAHGELGHNVYLFRNNVTTVDDMRQAFDFALQHGFALSIPADAAQAAHPDTDQGKWEAAESAKAKVDPTASYLSYRQVDINSIIATKPNGDVVTFPELMRLTRPVATRKFELSLFHQSLVNLTASLNSKELGMSGLVGTPAHELAKEITGLRGDRETLEKRIGELQGELATHVHSVTNKNVSTVAR